MALLRHAVAGSLAVVILAGCTMKVNRVVLDPARLVGASQAKVACDFRQGTVTDARPATGHAGGLSGHYFMVEDAPAILRARLAAAGMPADGEAGVPVNIRLLHMYMTQNQITKVPVIVLSASIEGQPPFTVRSQKGSMNWNGSEDEAYEGYARAFDLVIEQLTAQLNQSCSGR